MSIRFLVGSHCSRELNLSWIFFRTLDFFSFRCQNYPPYQNSEFWPAKRIITGCFVEKQLWLSAEMWVFHSFHLSLCSKRERMVSPNTFQVSLKQNTYFSRTLILTSSQAMHGGVTITFSCICLILHRDVSWAVCIPLNYQCCGQVWGGQGAVSPRSKAMYGAGAAATGTTWQEAASASPQISLRGWDHRSKPEKRA